MEEALLQQARSTLLPALEAECKTRFQEVLRMGHVNMLQVQELEEQQSQHLLGMVAGLRAAQAALEAENERLRQALLGVTSLVAQPWILGSPASTPSGCSTPSEGSCPGASPKGLPGSLAAASVPPPPPMAPALVPSLTPVSGPPPPSRPPAFRAFKPPALSLADALGFAPTRPPSPPQQAAPTPEELEPDGFVFGLALPGLRSLGCEMMREGGPGSEVLVVRRLLPGGSVEDWNKSCQSRVALLPGDQVVAVNSVAGDASAMLEAIRSAPELRLQVVRCGRDRRPPEEDALGLPPGLSEVPLGSPTRTPATPPPASPPAKLPLALAPALPPPRRDVGI